ncbi:MAG: sulfite exporter TauE/SafE family protein, partial [Patescibacteria group bacterium]
MDTNKKIIPIRGMHCASCEILIGEQLKKISGVTNVRVSQKNAQADIQYCGNPPDDAAIARAVQAAGYEVGAQKPLSWLSREKNDYSDLAKAAIILALLYYIARSLGVFDIAINTERTGLAIALLVGIVAGVSTCMALIGGLVLSLSARHAELHPEATPRQKFRPHLYFNLGRIAGYAILGGVIGMLGKAFQPSAGLLGLM